MSEYDRGYLDGFKDAVDQFKKSPITPKDDDITWCCNCEKYMMVKHTCMPRVRMAND